jgi:hypothetical protein
MINKNPNKKNYKKFLIGGLAVVLLVGAGLAIRHFTSNTTPATPEGVKLAPATPEEKQDADNNKDRIVASEKNGSSSSSSAPTETSNSKKQVTVVITNASGDMLNSYVSGVFEEGGTCTAAFTQGGSTITRTSQGFKNVSYTQCAPITPNLPNNAKWSVVVSYSSNTAEGKSAAQSF